MTSDRSALTPEMSDALETTLGYVFHSRSLLEEALTHASYANESGLSYHNERLEYLGDAVLELCVSEILYAARPDYDEGELTKVRSRVVREATLATWARASHLPGLLRLSRGLDLQGGRENPSILSDAMEAIFGAIFLDGGYEAAQAVIQRFVQTVDIDCEEPDKDAKSQLQEVLQALGDKPPIYRLKRRCGPDHAASFEVEVLLSNGRILSSGAGNSIKTAEFAAAKTALLTLEEKSGSAK